MTYYNYCNALTGDDEVVKYTTVGAASGSGFDDINSNQLKQSIARPNRDEWISPSINL